MTGTYIALAISVAISPAIGADGERAGTPPPLRPEAHAVTGITAPYAVVTLAAVQEGRIRRIFVPEGSMVRGGDLIFTLDDSVQRARTEIARAKSESTLNIELARAHWDRARRELDRLKALRGDDFASSKELSDALAEAGITRLEYDLAKFARALAVRAYAYEQRLLEELSVRAPFHGYVAEHLKEVGETVDQHEGILTLVRLDPLEVGVDCPLTLAPFVRVGDKVRVRPADTHWQPQLGTITLISRVADGASQTFKVKITVPNENGRWMSGLKVIVEFGSAHAAGS